MDPKVLITIFLCGDVMIGRGNRSDPASFYLQNWRQSHRRQPFSRCDTGRKNRFFRTFDDPSPPILSEVLVFQGILARFEAEGGLAEIRIIDAPEPRRDRLALNVGQST